MKARRKTWGAISLAVCAGFGPTLAHAQTQECGQFWFQNVGSYVVANNASGDPNQCITWYSNDSFTFTNSPGPGYGYPNVLQGMTYNQASTPLGGMPLQVSAIHEWPITWTNSGALPNVGQWDPAIEFWAWTFNPTVLPRPDGQPALGSSSCTTASCGQANGTELMVWLSASPGLTPAGLSPTRTASIAGIDWNVYATRGGPNAGISWNYIVYYAPNNSISTIATDFAPFFADAQTPIPGICQDATNKSAQCLDSSWWIPSVQAGIENKAVGSNLSFTSSGFISSLNDIKTCNLAASCSKGGTTAVSGVATTGIAANGASTSGYGVMGSSTSGDGVYGSTSSNTYPIAGVYGTSSAASGGIGVMGVATGASAAGVYGSGGQHGVFGYTSMSGGAGVDGHSSGAHGYGLVASCDGACATSGSPGGVALWAAGAAGGTTSWNSSDARLKKDIKDATYGLDQVLKLRPVTFHWRKEEFGKGAQFGLIAQEVEKVFPELVRSIPDGTLALNYVQVVPVLVRAIQQNEEKLAKLKRSRHGSALSKLRRQASGLALGLAPFAFVVMRRKPRKVPTRRG